MKRLWVICDVYYPDEIGAAYYLTGLAEHLAKAYDVAVLCGRPKYNAKGSSVPKRERRNGVSIERSFDSSLDKNVLVLRIFNVFVSSLSIWLTALARIRRGDLVIVITAPPLLPFVITAACKLRGAKVVLKIDDVYPEVFVATGLIRKGSLLGSSISFLNKVLYRSVDRIVVLGRDMAKLAAAKSGPRASRITFIPHWADTEAISPRPRAGNRLLGELGIAGKFVVQCAGNMGRAQAVEVILEAAERLRGREDIVFLLIGAGQKIPGMKKRIRDAALKNVILLGQRPREDQDNFLNACDVSLITLLPGMTGAGVPSRLYNVMAAGKPVIAVVREDSEIALTTREEDIGWVASPSEPGRLAEIILEAKSDPGRLADMGARARRLAETTYSKTTVLAAYERELRRED